MLTAREAMEWGLVNRVHPDAEFPAAVAALARELAAGADPGLRARQALFHQSTQESLETQMELEAQAIAASGHTEDFRNGVVAFARKQPVTFTGARSRGLGSIRASWVAGWTTSSRRASA